MSSASTPAEHHVLILGGGFGGLDLARSLRRAPVRVTLVDRRNFHLFQPLLYQVATGGLSPGDICSPIRRVLRRQRNARVLLGEVVDVDAAGRHVSLRDGARLDYDTLVVATGVSHHYFGHDEWAPRAPGLKTIEDATELRRRILYAFEAAERETDAGRRRAWLDFVVVGGGPTGVELAGALAELARDTLRDDFRAIDPREARILLVEGSGRVLPGYPWTLSGQALLSLRRLGVTPRLGTFVTAIDDESVVLEASDGRRERLQTRCVLWAAGVQGSPLGRTLARTAGASLDKAGRVLVEPDLTLRGHAEIFVIGDLAHFSHQTGAPLPGVAPVAMQQGRYVGRSLLQRLRGETPRPFRYRDRGNLATIGRSAAVADLGPLRFSGFPAWVLWLGIHLFFLIEFENRLLVMIQWAWNYFTRNRGARLIVGGKDGTASGDPPAEAG